jgi:thiol-disulfide isomerase/thioredoxin
MAALGMYDFERANPPAASFAAWRALATTRNPGLAALAAEKIRTLGALEAPVELKFTAIDGAEVDLAKLRGKVVLLDFWATWCVPCMEEMPNVRKAYHAWHSRGFEVIGVSCDVAPAAAATPFWAKAARTALQVLEFTRTHDMPWPEDYEGRKQNGGGKALAARFAVIGIPSSFLFDRTGRLVAMNLRGGELEERIRTLLRP